jgi:proteasome lid subunit RPN8/RPN11
MITWNNLSSDIEYQGITEYLSKLPVVDVIKIICKLDFLPLIIIDNEILCCINNHIITSNNELGGLLIGKVYVNPINKTPNIIVITDIIISNDYNSTSVSLIIDSNIWNNARTQIDNGFLVVGWYHSHPHLGAFFSGTDRKTQKNNFNQVYNVGYVVDPYKMESKWFIGADSNELALERVITSGCAPVQPNQPKIVVDTQQVQPIIDVATTSEKKCPHCSGVIKVEATICRYCCKDLPQEIKPSEPGEIYTLLYDYDNCVYCPMCKTRLQLDVNEVQEKIFDCPECESKIIFEITR